MGGVLLSGERGTGKSTAVRAFAQMIAGQLPVTLPINATEDRLVGGWKVNELIGGHAAWQRGLLEDADEKGMLYVDEVNLLDDHIVNIILDVTSTGVLEIQREGQREQKFLSFTLVGTMNPEEGSLRPQLLDRFGLMVSITAETDKSLRNDLLHTLLEYDKALFQKQQGKSAPLLNDAYEKNQICQQKLKNARQNFNDIALSITIKKCCVDLAAELKIEGHRGEYVMALAAQAYAALKNAPEVALEHLEAVYA